MTLPDFEEKITYSDTTNLILLTVIFEVLLFITVRIIKIAWTGEL